MTAVHAELQRVDGELSSAVDNAQQAWSRRSMLLLRLRDEVGRIGWGEAAPLPGRSADTIDEAQTVLTDVSRALRVDLDMPADGLLDFAASKIPASQPAARFALETALLDLAAKRRGVAVHGLWSHSPSRLSRAALIEGPPDTWPAQTQRWYDEGYRHLKFKIGKDLTTELEALHNTRVRHPDLSLRADANQSLTAASFAAHRGALEDLQLEFLEEPFVHDADAWTDALRAQVPLALDESLLQLDASALRARLREPKLRALVLKPTLLGGFKRCRELAAMAQTQDTVAVVSHALEGGVALAAAAQLALSLPAATSPGLGPHRGLSVGPPFEIRTLAGPKLLHDGANGIGVTLAEQA